MSRRKPLPPIRTVDEIQKWIRANVKKPILVRLQHQNVEEATLWFLAHRELEVVGWHDMNTRQWVETLLAGITPLTLEDCEEQLEQDAEDDPELDLREELEAFWKGEDSCR